MVTGLSLVITHCRVNRDLVKNGENRYVVEIDEINRFAGAVEKLSNCLYILKFYSEIYPYNLWTNHYVIKNKYI